MQRRGQMLRNTKIQMMLVLVAGVVLGYCVASGKVRPFETATAAPPTEAAGEQSGTETCCSAGEKASFVSTTAQAEEEIIEFEILVPATAVVLIDGEATKSTGVVRHFQTPPLPTGK